MADRVVIFWIPTTSDYLTYNFKLALISPLIGVYLTQRYVSGKSRPGWAERCGQLPEALNTRPEGRPRIWMHAASAGEVVAAVPILRELRAALPQYEIVFSVITPAGHEMASQQAAPFIDTLFYFPFDLPWIARRVVATIRPAMFVSLESDMWPNVLHELKRQGAQTALVNGRISERNYTRTRRYGRRFYRWMLSNMDHLLMQSAADTERIRDLSGRQQPDGVRVLGNSKFDQQVTRFTPQQVGALRAGLQLPADAPIFVAGSTRSVEEEAQVTLAYQAMQREFPTLCLVLAPRKVERAAEVVETLRAAGLQPVRRTLLGAHPGPVRHLVLDTMGELADVYAVADIAFVGNSFPPVVKGGGQNLLQPLAHGKPVFVGPQTATIRSEIALAREAQVGFVVADGAALASGGIRLLRDAALRQEIAMRARDLIAANQGVSLRYARALTEILAGSAGGR